MTDEKQNAIRSLKVLIIILISGFIAAYTSNMYYQPTELITLIPAIGAIIIQLFLFNILDLSKGTRKNNIYIGIMTILAWFISYTIILQI